MAPPPTRVTTAPWVCVIAAIAIGCRSCLDGGFAHDDTAVLERHPFPTLRGPDPPALLRSLLRLDFWGTELSSFHSHGSYRPVTTLGYGLTTWLWAQSAGEKEPPSAAASTAAASLPLAPPIAYRGVSFLLHAAVAVAAFFAYLRATGSLHGAVVGAALVAAHPALTETVCGVAGQADLLATLLGLLAVGRVAAYVPATRDGDTRWNLAVALAFGALATLSKESGVMWLGVGATVAALLGGAGDAAGARARRAALACIISALSLVVGRVVLQGGRSPLFTVQENIVVGLTGEAWALTVAWVAARHASLLVWPAPLGIDWALLSVPPVVNLEDERNGWTAMVGAVLAVLFFVGLWGEGRGGGRKRSASESLLGAPPAVAKISAARGRRSGTEGGDGDADVSSAAAAEAPRPARAASRSPGRKRAPQATAAAAASSVSLTAFEVAPPSLVLKQKLAAADGGAFSSPSSPLPLAPSRALLLALASAALLYLPASSLLFPVGFTIAERALYGPAVAFGLAVAALLAMVLGEGRGPLLPRLFTYLLSVAALASFVYLAHLRADDFRSEDALWASLARVNPDNAKAAYQAGLSAQRAGDVESATRAYLESLAVFERQRERVRAVHPGLGEWDALYPDPAVNLYHVLVETKGARGTRTGEDVALAVDTLRRALDAAEYGKERSGVGGGRARERELRRRARTRAAAARARAKKAQGKAPWAAKRAGGAATSVPEPPSPHPSLSGALSALEDSCSVLPSDAETVFGPQDWGEDAEVACALTGSAMRVDPRQSRLVDRLLSVGLSHLNLAVVGGELAGKGVKGWVDDEAARNLLKASALVGRVAAPLLPPGIALHMGDVFMQRGLWNLAGMFYEREIKGVLAGAEAGAEELRAAFVAAVRAAREVGGAGWEWEGDDGMTTAAAAEHHEGGEVVVTVSGGAENLAEFDGSDTTMRLPPRVAHALYGAVQVQAPPPKAAAATATTATDARVALAAKGGRYCLALPHVQGARHGGPPAPSAATRLRELYAGAAHGAPPFPFACPTPNNASTPCGRVLVAAARAAEAAVSAFKDAQARGAITPARDGEGLCGCRAAGSSLRLCAHPLAALPEGAQPPHGPAPPHVNLMPEHRRAQAVVGGCEGRAACVRREDGDADGGGGGGGGGGAGQAPLLLSDFASTAPDAVTFPQAVFLAVRAEALVSLWVGAGDGGMGGGEGEASSSSWRRAQVAGGGPLSAVVGQNGVCGCPRG
jgi:tetratricopeptide (TPR) repeat protein